MTQRKTLASEEASYSDDAAKKKSDISQDVNIASLVVDFSNHVRS
jgi:hypothetical protein